MPSIPDTWRFSLVPFPALGASGTVTVPAPASNVQRVITHLHADFINQRGDATNVNVVLKVLDGGNSIFEWVMVTNCPAGTFDIATFDEDTILVGSPGNVIVVGFSAGAVLNCFELIRVDGYDL